MGVCGGRKLGHEGRTLMNGISVLTRRDPQEIPCPFLSCEDMAKRSSVNQDEGPHETWNLLVP